MTPSHPPAGHTAAPANPLLQGLAEERVPPPCTMVIFGASGDLTKRKLVPALYSLYHDRRLPPGFSVVGYARRGSQDEFRAGMREAVSKFARVGPVSGELWDGFVQGVFYCQANFNDPAGYQKLKQQLERIDLERGTQGNRIFYISTPPEHFETILSHLHGAGLVEPDLRTERGPTGPFARIIIEKPFGTDLPSAIKLNDAVRAVASESQTFRIDHYLGKETVQNILVFRFGNGIFEPIWNHKYVDHVQLTVAESIGIEGRADYFDKAGILRDIVQNHLFQVFCLIAMEAPVAFESQSVRDEKVKVLKALRPVPDSFEEFQKMCVRGQYTAGSSGGKPVPGYLEEPKVPPGSHTETYVALKMFVDNWRWAGVPFYLRAGKRLPKRVSEVAIHFKTAPHLLFARSHTSLEPNVLALRIQPDEGISLKFSSKVPGTTLDINPVTMEFRYGSSFGAEPPEAYERLLLDCMLGDSTLFTRRDEVELSWEWNGKLLDAWARDDRPLPGYEAGTWGPREADELLERDGRAWRRL